MVIFQILTVSGLYSVVPHFCTDKRKMWHFFDQRVNEIAACCQCHAGSPAHITITAESLQLNSNCTSNILN